MGFTGPQYENRTTQLRTHQVPVQSPPYWKMPKFVRNVSKKGVKGKGMRIGMCEDKSVGGEAVKDKGRK